MSVLSLSIDSASSLHGLHHLQPSVFTCKKEKSIQLMTIGWIALNCDSPDSFSVLFQQSVNKSPVTAESLVSSSVTWQKTRLNTKWNTQWKRELPIHLLSLCIPSGSHNFRIPALPQQSHQPVPWPNQWTTLERLRIAEDSCFTVLFYLRCSPSAFWWKNPKSHTSFLSRLEELFDGLNPSGNRKAQLHEAAVSALNRG